VTWKDFAGAKTPIELNGSFQGKPGHNAITAGEQAVPAAFEPVANRKTAAKTA
jgi:hypothetical protein